MRKLINIASIIALCLVMALSSLVVVSAEEIDYQNTEEKIVLVSSDDDSSSKAYELVWKYKYDYGHLWKRRWNATLGAWYDPDWILVY